MAPIVDLDFSTTTTTARTTTTNNSQSTYIANTSVVNSASFLKTSQDTMVGNSELKTRTIVPPTISAELCRKAMISDFIF